MKAGQQLVLKGLFYHLEWNYTLTRVANYTETTEAIKLMNGTNLMTLY